MRIRPPKTRSTAARITLNLTSMIDVTFLLLIYFLVTTVIQAQEDRLSPTLQTQSDAASGPDTDYQPQVVEVMQSDGRQVYKLGSNTLSDRAQLLRALRGLPKDAGVFIKVRDDVTVGFATAAIQTARDAGFEQVTYVPVE